MRRSQEKGWAGIRRPAQRATVLKPNGIPSGKRRLSPHPTRDNLQRCLVHATSLAPGARMSAGLPGPRFLSTRLRPKCCPHPQQVLLSAPSRRRSGLCEDPRRLPAPTQWHLATTTDADPVPTPCVDPSAHSQISKPSGEGPETAGRGGGRTGSAQGVEAKWIPKERGGVNAGCGGGALRLA